MTISKLTIATLGALAFVATPAVAEQTATPTAQEQCRELRASMVGTTFAQTFGTNANKKNAFGKCVAQRASATSEAKSEARTNAAKECKAEQADTTSVPTFEETYGNRPNAYGKCVSTKARAKTNETVEAQLEATENAAKSCKADRKDDAEAFATAYGTKRNAFGKCVSAKAKAQQDEQEESTPAA